MARATGDAVFMHCLPAHQGEEVTAEVIDGPQSIVFPQAANRLPTGQAVLCALLEGTLMGAWAPISVPQQKRRRRGDVPYVPAHHM